MGGRLTGFAFILLAGCQQPVDDRAVPTGQDIARLEARLTGHACVGDLANWERNYRYSRTSGLFTPYSFHPDLDVIEFHLRRAGTVTIEPGIKVVMPGQSGDWPDSAGIRAVEGSFKIKGGMLDFAACRPLER